MNKIFDDKLVKLIDNLERVADKTIDKLEKETEEVLDYFM
jgi:hypothetical protein